MLVSLTSTPFPSRGSDESARARADPRFAMRDARADNRDVSAPHARPAVSLPFRSAIVLAVAFVLAGDACARSRHVTDPDAPRSLPASGAVDVRWQDPARFTEIRRSGNPREAARGTWVLQLAEHLRVRAGRHLAAGERLAVEIVDIDRAGEYEPWHGIQYHDIRVIRDLYPPRIVLRFERTAADRRVLARGERTLRDAAFLMHTSGAGDGDPLRHEKAMLERWLARELGTAHAVAIQGP